MTDAPVCSRDALNACCMVQKVLAACIAAGAVTCWRDGDGHVTSTRCSTFCTRSQVRHFKPLSCIQPMFGNFMSTDSYVSLSSQVCAPGPQAPVALQPVFRLQPVCCCTCGGTPLRSCVTAIVIIGQSGAPRRCISGHTSQSFYPSSNSDITTGPHPTGAQAESAALLCLQTLR